MRFGTDNSTIALQLLTKEGGGEAHFSQKKCEYKGLRDIQIWSTILQLSSATIGSNQEASIIYKISLNINIAVLFSQFQLLKFIYSEKATKFEDISLLVLVIQINVKTTSSLKFHYTLIKPKLYHQGARQSIPNEKDLVRKIKNSELQLHSFEISYRLSCKSDLISQLNIL